MFQVIKVIGTLSQFHWKFPLNNAPGRSRESTFMVWNSLVGMMTTKWFVRTYRQRKIHYSSFLELRFEIPISHISKLVCSHLTRDEAIHIFIDFHSFNRNIFNEIYVLLTVVPSLAQS